MADAVTRLHEVMDRASVGPRPQVGDAFPARPAWLVRLLRRVDLSAVEWAVLSSLPFAAAPLGLLAWILIGATTSLVVTTLAIGAPLGMLVLWRDRAATRLTHALPPVFEALARDLRSGRPLAQAIQRACDGDNVVATRLRPVARSIELGRSLETATPRLAQPDDSAELKAAAALLTMASVGGAGAALALDTGAAAMRARDGLDAEMRALVAQSRASVRILAALPIGFVGIGLVAGLEGTLTLFVTPTGRTCLVVGLALDLLGLTWMRALVRGVASQ